MHGDSPAFSQTAAERSVPARLASSPMGGLAARLIFIMVSALLIAQVLAAMMVPTITRIVTTAPPPSQEAITASPFKLRSRPNFHDLRRSILERNLFNLSGEVPASSEVAARTSEPTASFDLSAPCRETRLKSLTLRGIIAAPEAPEYALAVIQEDGVTTSDLYRNGDSIIDHDEASVVAVLADQVILNNGGSKECLFLNNAPKQSLQAAGPSPSTRAAQQAKDQTSYVTLPFDYVRDELGDGFSKILVSARMVPNTTASGTNGFKVFAIRPDSLFDRAGLRNGDVITQVNQTVLEAAQGFAVYQAFQDEQLITLTVLRHGEQTATLRVEVR